MPCPLYLPHLTACAAAPGIAPEQGMLARCCRRGYARDVCAHAATLEADATALLIKSDRDGVIEVAWSMERNHHPVSVGIIAVTAHFGAGTTLEHQAHNLALEYLRTRA